MKKQRIAVNGRAARRHGIRVPRNADDPYISPNEAGLILGVTGEAVKNYIYQRRLPAIKLANGYWRIKKSDLERFIHARIVGPVAKVLVFSSGSLRPIITAAVEKTGRTPTATATFADAVLKVAGEYPSAAIIDLAAGDEGWALLERIRTMKGHGAMPVLLIAPATLSDTGVERALATGVKAVLLAPVSAEKVAAELTSVMARL